MSDAEMRVVALAAEAPSFDEVGTGEIDVRNVRVKTKPETPDPVPYGVVADLTWVMPSVLPRGVNVPPLFWVAALAGVVVAPLVVAGVGLLWGAWS